MISGSYMKDQTRSDANAWSLIRSPNALAFTAVLKRSLTIVTPVTQLKRVPTALCTLTSAAMNTAQTTQATTSFSSLSV